MFMRGDYDVAVFQAFKEVEVAVRTAAGLPDSEVGVSLMRNAFHPSNGKLTDTESVMAEREAVSSLYAGAIGHEQIRRATEMLGSREFPPLNSLHSRAIY